MLRDELLMARYARRWTSWWSWPRRRCSARARTLVRPLARFYRDRFAGARHAFHDVYAATW
jgi:hypothetical protein